MSHAKRKRRSKYGRLITKRIRRNLSRIDITKVGPRARSQNWGSGINQGDYGKPVDLYQQALEEMEPDHW